jgi:predicted RNase H-like HicB family nuclease/DNA-binding XRE family transcriptional regulator
MFYAAKIIKDKDMGYVASFPDKENVITSGSTLEQAREAAAEALNGTLETELSLGMSLIEPKVLPNAKKNLYAIDVHPELEIAYRLFEARRGKTKQEVAKAAGMTKQAYQRFETPAGNPTIATLYRLAKACGKHLEIRLV